MFYGRESVIELRDLFLETGKLLTSAVLTKSDGSGTVTYANAYVYPVQEQTALGQGGTPNATTHGVIFQLGESDAPRVDDAILVGGDSWLVLNVLTSDNADASYARHSLSLIRAT